MDAKQTKLLPTDILKSVFQVGFVVDDLDSTIDGMRKVLGVEPESASLMTYPGVRYRDQVVDATARIAFYRQFGVELEFIQPVGSEATIWKDYLDNCSGQRNALHHVRFNDVDDNDVLTEILAERGVEVYQEGDSIVNPGSKFTYYDTVDQLGFVIEVVTKKKD